MAAQRPTPTVEDYLGIIYTMERDGEAIIGARLAEWMEVSHPTVTVTLQRMVRDGWITLSKDKHVSLTSEGRTAAISLLRRHMLTEWLLSRVLGVPWSRIHAEADEMEHTISPETLERMLTRLDQPKVCPHGNPLPGYEMVAEDWIQISQIEPGTKVIIRRVHEQAEDDPELLAFLEERELIPDTVAIVREVLTFNNTITLSVAGEDVVLGMAVADLLYGEVAAEQTNSK